MLTIPFKKGTLPGKRKGIKNYEEYLSRIKKSLYYVKLPKTYCTSLPCTELAAEIFSEINKYGLDKLHIEEAANLSHNACVSPCSFVLALLYLDRLKSANPKYLTKVSPSELFLISLMVGSKFLQDDGEEDEVNNSEWAASAGIHVEDINRAEKQFLDAIKWEVFVSEKEFWERFHALECKLGLRQGSRRGWFTYTELHLLLELIDITNIIQAVCTVITGCLTGYTASMLTLLGSALLVGQIPLGFRANMQELESRHNWHNNISSWNSTSSILHAKNIEEQPKISLINFDEFEVTHKLNICNGCCNFNNVHIPNCMNWKSLHLILKVSHAEQQDATYSLMGDLDDKNNLKIFHIRNTIWNCLHDIRNFLLMNSVPNSILPIINF